MDFTITTVKEGNSNWAMNKSAKNANEREIFVFLSVIYIHISPRHFYQTKIILCFLFFKQNVSRYYCTKL